MKHMKTRMIRFVAVFMSLMLLVSAMVVPASAAPLFDDSNNAYGISYANGIYTIGINADTLTDILQSRAYDKQTLAQVLPASLYTFLVNKDANSALAVLKELYASADLDALKGDLPLHIIKDNFTKQDILNLLDTDALKALIDVDALMSEILSDPAINVEDLFKDGALDSYLATADLSGLVTDAVVSSLLSALTTDELVAALKDGTVDALINEGILDPSSYPADATEQEIIESITDKSVLVEYVNTAALPQQKVIDAIGTETIVEYFMTNDRAGLIKIVDFKYVLSLDASKAAISEITLDEIKAVIDVEAIKADFLPKALDAFLGAVLEIQLNGVSVYADKALDLTALQYAVLQSIPTPEDIANIGANGGEVLSFVLTYEVYDATAQTFATYQNGFEVVLVGDTTAIAEHAVKVDGYIHYDINMVAANAIAYDYVIHLPEKLAELYVTSLTDTELSQELRDKLFGIGNATIDQTQAETAVDNLINKLTLSELGTVLKKVDMGKYNQILLDQMELHRSQAETIRAKLIEVLDRVLTSAVDSDAAATTYGKTLADFYTGEGNFVLDVAFTLDFAVPEMLEGFVINTSVRNEIALDVTATDLYQVQFVDQDNVLFTAYRTEGCDLAELFALPEITAAGVTKWIDQDGNIYDPAATNIMPAADVTLTAVRTFLATFVVDGEVVGTDEFDPSDPATLDFPELINKHAYTLMWDPYTLEYADITITGTYVPTVFTAMFMNGGLIWAVRSYTFETIVSTFMPDLPVAPNGYAVAWDLPVLPLADVTINAVYTPITYYVTFVDADGNEIAKVPFTVEDIEIEYPEVPEKDGCVGTWPALTAEILLDAEYYLENGFSYDRTVAPTYDSNVFYVTFLNKAGETIAKVPYTVGMTDIDEPAVPAVKGYKAGKWAAYDLSKGGDITVSPVYELQTYYITFVDKDNKTVKKVAFDIEDTKITDPAVPAVKGYENGKWASYKLFDEAVYTKTGSYNQTVKASYDLITYHITFADKDGKQVGDKVAFNINTKQSAIKTPAVPSLDGYTVAWPSFKLFNEDVYTKTGSYSFTVTAVYTAVGEVKTYTATFVADGKEVAKVTFEATDSKLTEPAVPEKTGYTGAWESYTLGAADITINAVYTLVEYTVTFVADGETVGTATYTVEDKNITEPAVPTKEGFEGKWEAYTLTTGDVTVNAVYTEVTPPDVDDGPNLLWLWILIAVVVVGGAVAAVIILKKKGIIGAPKA